MTQTPPVPASAPALRLPTPDFVCQDRVLWMYAIPIAALHAAALLGAWPALFSWTGLIVCFVGVHVYGQAINIGYHRLLTHRSFEVPRWLKHLIVWMAMGCLQDTPGRWVATHRLHHQYSDEEKDPHTPRVTFFWAHMGWLMYHNPESNTIATYQKYARDVLSDRWYMVMEKNRYLPLALYLSHAAIFFVVAAVAGFLMGWDASEVWRWTASVVLWGVVIRTVLVWHITWSVNSLTHLFGYQNYDTGDGSRNNWLVALLSVGEGWHNNHHDDPASASNQHRWWELDLSYYGIRLLELLGLARAVIRPRKVRRKQRGR